MGVKSHEWPTPGIVSLKPKPVGSHVATEWVREADIQRDSLLRLWKATSRPVLTPNPDLKKMFAALRRQKFKDDKSEDEIRSWCSGQVLVEKPRAGSRKHMSRKTQRNYWRSTEPSRHKASKSSQAG